MRAYYIIIMAALLFSAPIHANQLHDSTIAGGAIISDPGSLFKPPPRCDPVAHKTIWLNGAWACQLDGFVEPSTLKPFYGQLRWVSAKVTNKPSRYTHFYCDHNQAQIRRLSDNKFSRIFLMPQVYGAKHCIKKVRGCAEWSNWHDMNYHTLTNLLANDSAIFRGIEWIHNNPGAVSGKHIVYPPVSYK